MASVALCNPGGGARLLLTCEQASAAIPAADGNLGLSAQQLAEHIGWDIGAAQVTEELSRQLDAPAALSVASRLLVDCNRDLDDQDLMPRQSHGIAIPGNVTIDAGERAHRLAAFYYPYHDTVESRVQRQPEVFLLSVHSFTPFLDGCERMFDVGVLFDDFTDLAEDLRQGIAAAGFSVRMNEPYSALDGLNFSARKHGRRNRVPYLEIEINNCLLRCETDAQAVARRLCGAVGAWIGA